MQVNHLLAGSSPLLSELLEIATSCCKIINMECKPSSGVGDQHSHHALERWHSHPLPSTELGKKKGRCMRDALNIPMLVAKLTSRIFNAILGETCSKNYNLTIAEEKKHVR